MMYLAFLFACLLITTVNYKTEPLNHDYKDLNNKDVDIIDYCDIKPCVVKCCNKGEFLNDKGVCTNSTGFEIYYKILSNYNFSINLWDEANIRNNTTKKLNKDMVFVTNERYSFRNPTKYLTSQFYLIRDGSLRVDRLSQKGIYVAPLQFCVDYAFNSLTNVPIETAVIYNYDSIYNQEDNSTFQLILYGTGLLSSIIGVILLLYRIPSRMRSTLATILTMCIFPVIAGYILKLAQVTALNTGFKYFDDCRVISPALYIFVLSSFCWSNLIFYDVWWRMCCLRNKTRKFNENHSNLRILCYHLYGFGIPMLLSVAAVTVDKLKLYETWPIEKSPFDTCFMNDIRTMWYLQVPIGILIMLDCILFLKFFYSILMYRQYILELIEKIPQLKNKPTTVIFTTKHRQIMIRKICSILIITIIIEIVHNVPIIMYLTLHLYNLCVLVTFIILVVFKKSVFAKINTSSNVTNKGDDKIQAIEYLKKFKSKLACATIIKNWNNSKTVDKDKLIWTTDVV